MVIVAKQEAVAIIYEEIATRENVDMESCQEFGREKLEKRNETVRKKRTTDIKDEASEQISSVVNQAYEKYGDEIYMMLVQTACHEAPLNIDLYNRVRDYAAAKLPGKYAYVSHIASNKIGDQIVGFGSALQYFAYWVPTFCATDGIEKLQGVLQKSFSSGADYTSQNVEADLALGIDKAVVITQLGEPIFSERLGLVEEEHYCRTGRVSDEYLVLYYFEDKLMARNSYKVEFEDVNRGGDCKEFIREGSYELPQVIRALNSSRTE